MSPAKVFAVAVVCLLHCTLVTADRPADLTLEQALLRLRQSPPRTATDFLARLTSDFANGLDVSSASESKVKMPSGGLFRAYATEGDDANSAAVESNEIDGAQPRQRPFSPAQLGDIPPSANCEPELRAVRVAPLVQTQSASRGAQVSQDLYFPHCIRLPVCGGCCPSARLQCQATQVSRQNVSVLHLRYSARERRFRLGGVARVEVERHGRCACQCITRPADCGPGQLYRAAECRCLCPPTAQAVCLKRQRAAGSLPARFVSWNAASCQCECKPPGGVWRCAAGFWFDGSTCSCQRIHSKQHSQHRSNKQQLRPKATTAHG